MAPTEYLSMTPVWGCVHSSPVLAFIGHLETYPASRPSRYTATRDDDRQDFDTREDATEWLMTKAGPGVFACVVGNYFLKADPGHAAYIEALAAAGLVVADGGT